jgi:hypothetical protein
MASSRKTVEYIEKAFQKRLDLAKKIYDTKQIEYLNIVDECNAGLEQIDMYGLNANESGAFGIQNANLFTKTHMNLFLKLKEIEDTIPKDVRESQDWHRIKFSSLSKVMLHFYYRIRQFCRSSSS